MDEIRENAHRIVQLIHQSALMRLRATRLSRRLDNISGHIDDELKTSHQLFQIVAPPADHSKFAEERK